MNKIWKRKSNFNPSGWKNFPLILNEFIKTFIAWLRIIWLSQKKIPLISEFLCLGYVFINQIHLSVYNSCCLLISNTSNFQDPIPLSGLKWHKIFRKSSFSLITALYHGLTASGKIYCFIKTNLPVYRLWFLGFWQCCCVITVMSKIPSLNFEKKAKILILHKVEFSWNNFGVKCELHSFHEAVSKYKFWKNSRTIREVVSYYRFSPDFHQWRLQQGSMMLFSNVSSV